MTEAYELRNMIEAEQLEFAAMLRGLAPEQWEVASLCEGWSVHDAVVHIAWHTHTTDVGRTVQLLKARNSERRVLDSEAAIRSNDELIDYLASPATLGGPSNLRTQLTELASYIAWENYRSRFNRALGVQAVGFSDGDFCVVPEHSR